MIDYLFNTKFLPMVLLSMAVLAFLVQAGFYLVVFYRLARYRPLQANPGKSPNHEPVSVVICAHNACHQLKENLPLVLSQDYPEYEVVVVNHSSDDDTPYLLNELSERHPHLTAITIKEDLNFFSGKKFPLSIGIKSAKYNTILLTDADCRPASPHWIRTMQSGYGRNTEILLGYGAYDRTLGFVNRLIRFDTAHIAVQYLSYALAGMPYMGVGRNLSYRKELFYRNKGFIEHYRIKSGDDDLFINRAAKGSNTRIMVDPEGFTMSEPKSTFTDWIIQKRRHLSTSTFYRFRHRFTLGSYALSMGGFYAFTILLLAFGWSVYPVLLLLLLRMALQYMVFTPALKRLNEKDLAAAWPFLEIVLIFVNAGCFVANLFHKPVRWK